MAMTTFLFVHVEERVKAIFAKTSIFKSVASSIINWSKVRRITLSSEIKKLALFDNTFNIGILSTIKYTLSRLEFPC